MSREPREGYTIGRSQYFEFDGSEPTPEHLRNYRPIRPEDEEARRRRLWLAFVAAAALTVGVLIGRFLLP
jgi:hypothetical protein